MSALAPLGWQFDGECNYKDPEAFFPHPTETVKIEAAKAVCKLCPVKPQCLQFALDLGIRHGIWGGLTEGERRQLDSAATRAHNRKEAWQIEHGTPGGAQWERRHLDRLCDACAASEHQRSARTWQAYRERQDAEKVTA